MGKKCECIKNYFKFETQELKFYFLLLLGFTPTRELQECYEKRVKG